MMYKEVILDLYRNPLHTQKLADPTHIATASNPSCGDLTHVQLDVQDKVIEGVAHSTSGCAISTAGVSLFLEEIQGMSLQEVQSLTQEDIIELFGVPITHNRLKCALLGWRSVIEAIE